MCKLIVTNLIFNYYLIGIKYWKTSRRIKAMKLDEYLMFKDIQDFDPCMKASGSKGCDLEWPYQAKAGTSGVGTNKRPRFDDDEDYGSRFELLESKIKLIESDMESQKQWEVEKATLQLEIDQYVVSMRENEAKLKSEQSKVDKLQGTIQVVKDTLQCTICKELLDAETVMFCCCNLLACKTCANRWIDQSDNCPHCRAPARLQTLIPVRRLQPIIEKLENQIPPTPDAVQQ